MNVASPRREGAVRRQPWPRKTKPPSGRTSREIVNPGDLEKFVEILRFAGIPVPSQHKTSGVTGPTAVGLQRLSMTIAASLFNFKQCQRDQLRLLLWVRARAR